MGALGMRRGSLGTGSRGHGGPWGQGMGFLGARRGFLGTRVVGDKGRVFGDIKALEDMGQRPWGQGWGSLGTRFILGCFLGTWGGVLGDEGVIGDREVLRDKGSGSLGTWDEDLWGQESPGGTWGALGTGGLWGHGMASLGRWTTLGTKKGSLRTEGGLLGDMVVLGDMGGCLWGWGRAWGQRRGPWGQRVGSLGTWGL